jgi:hypothetical protein
MMLKAAPLPSVDKEQLSSCAEPSTTAPPAERSQLRSSLMLAVPAGAFLVVAWVATKGFSSCKSLRFGEAHGRRNLFRSYAAASRDEQAEFTLIYRAF